jgi:hypothetical protein
MTDELDILLSRPLPMAADDGFSARVMGEVRALRRRRFFVTVAGFSACAVLALVLLPLKSIGAELGTIVPAIADNAALNFAMAVLVLTFLIEQQFSRL